jgi:hypothetical protein
VVEGSSCLDDLTAPQFLGLFKIVVGKLHELQLC